MDFVDTNIIITEPYFNFGSIQESMNEILFEEYQFQAVLRVNGKSMFCFNVLKPNLCVKEWTSFVFLTLEEQGTFQYSIPNPD